MSATLVPLQVPMLPGGPEWIVILLIAVLLFGANKIPKLARSTGQAMGEFQKGRQEVEEEIQEIKEGPDVESGTATESEAAVETESTTSDSAGGESTSTESTGSESA